ncbi:MAG: HAMP domain-containing histidine kinase, partial [Bacteriovoracaceae bacterium]|nr:HAMP domain-containing histidine kinase [Bacteriovoracaceae bacterium]
MVALPSSAAAHLVWKLPLHKHNQSFVQHFCAQFMASPLVFDLPPQNKGPRTLSNFFRLPAAIKASIKKLKNQNNLPENLQELLLRKQELENLFGKFGDLAELTKAILNLKIFRGHHSCQIIVQTKGLAGGEVFRYEHQKGTTIYPITSKDFGELFQTIKKSKHKLFHHEQFKLLEGLRGTFLAKELTLRKHHVILMISRHDFLPPTAREQSFFGHMALLLGPVIENLLAALRRNRQQKIAMVVLEIFPAPLTIIPHKNLPFTNLAARNNPTSANYLLRRSHHQVLKIGLDHQQDLAPDIYHFQRIQLLGELLNTLHHELCNPLFGLKLWAQIMAQELPPHLREGLDFLTEIGRHAVRCQNIIENFSLLYNDKQESSWIDLQVLLPEIMLLVKSAGRQIKKELIFMPECAGPMWFKTNPTWLTQILFNLLMNSTQALNEGGVLGPQIILRVFHQETSTITFCVEDNGTGIEEEDLPRIFLPFFTTKKNGTGLGLAICKNLTSRLQGSIRYQKNQGPGISFLVTLPRPSTS